MLLWFEDLPLNFARPETREAARLLVIAYNDLPLALALAQDVGLDTATIKPNLTPKHLIEDVMRAARLADRLPKLLEEAMADPRCEAIRGDLAALIKRPEPPTGEGDDPAIRGDNEERIDDAAGLAQSRKWPVLVIVLFGAIIGIAALLGWPRPKGGLKIKYLAPEATHSDVVPGQRLTSDLSVVVSRSAQQISLAPSYTIKSASKVCGMGAAIGSWKAKIDGESLVATVPFRLENLLEPCEVIVEASVAEHEETAAVTKTFVFAPAKRNLIAVEAGAHFGCVLKSSGEVMCWGGLGGLYGDISPPSGLRARAIAAGTYSVCAILRGTGTVRCWGDGRVVGGRSEIKPSERAIIGPVAGITGGTRMFCATFPDRDVDCWSRAGTITIQFNVPHLENVRTLFGRRACGMADGDLVCADFDLPTYGSLIDRSSTHALPTFWRASSVISKKIIGFAAPATDNVCALLEDRAIRCYSFTRGSVIDITNRFPPNVQSVIDNGQFVCVLTDSGSISCSRIDEFRPAPMASLTEGIEDFKAVAITAADYYGLCAISADDRIGCWSVGDSDGHAYPFVGALPDSIRAGP